MKKITQQDLQSLYAPADQQLQDRVTRALASLPTETEERQMKKKMIVSIALAALLVLSTATALAAGNWAKIREFLGSSGTVAHLALEDSAIAAPVSQSCDSTWLKIEVTQAYWSTEGLHLTMHVAAADTNQLAAVIGELDGGGEEEDLPLDDRPVWIDGKQTTIGQWRQGREILEYSIWAPDHEGWCYFQRDDEGEAFILTVFELDEKELEEGASLQLEVHASNLITHANETSALHVDLPPMRQQAGRE